MLSLNSAHFALYVSTEALGTQMFAAILESKEPYIFVSICGGFIAFYYCPLKVSEQRDIHPQCCCNGIADDFSEGKPLS